MFFHSFHSFLPINVRRGNTVLERIRRFLLSSFLTTLHLYQLSQLVCALTLTSLVVACKLTGEGEGWRQIRRKKKIPLFFQYISLTQPSVLPKSFPWRPNRELHAETNFFGRRLSPLSPNTESIASISSTLSKANV
jgi:hypothetical protein